MPSEENDRMPNLHAFDEIIDVIRRRDDTPAPGPAFLRSLEASLISRDHLWALPRMARSDLAPSTTDVRWLGLRLGSAASRSRLAFGSIAACLLVLAAVGGAVGYRALDGAPTPLPETIAAFTGATPAGRSGSGPSASPPAAPLAGQEVPCTTPGREAGTFEAIMSGPTGLSPRSFTPIVANGVSAAIMPVLDSDHYLAGYLEVHDERVAAIDAALAQLWACRFSATSGSMALYDGDAPYWALHTETALRRAAADAPEGLGAFNMLEDLTMRRFPYPVSAVRVHEFESFGLPRVAATLSGPAPCRDRGAGSTQPGYIIVFALVDGRWLVDEIAVATFDDIPAPTAPLAPEPLDLIVGDIVDGEHVNDGNVILYGACDAALWAGEPGVLRVHNAGSQAILVLVESLGIEVKVRPGEVDAVTVQSPAGRADYSIVGVDDQSTAYGTLTFVAPGEPRPFG